MPQIRKLKLILELLDVHRSCTSFAFGLICLVTGMFGVLPFVALAQSPPSIVQTPPLNVPGTADCAAISSDTLDKIVIGKVKGVLSIDSRIQRERLRSAINMQLPEIKSNLNEFVKLIFCERRTPDEATFDRDRSKLLSEVGVILEIWGEVDGLESVLSYAVVPVRLNQYFIKSNESLTGFYTAVYKAGSVDTTVELQALFKEKPELQGFANLALAEKFSQRVLTVQSRVLKTRAYDNARTFFCNSISLLTKAHESGLKDLRESEWNALTAYAEESAREIARRAIDDTEYSGAMKILPRNKIEKCS